MTDKLKNLLFQGHYNDLFTEIEKNLPKSDSLQLRYFGLKQKWLSRDANFNEDTWKGQMLEFIKEFAKTANPQPDKAEINDWQKFEQAIAAGKLNEFSHLLDTLQINDSLRNSIIGFQARFNSLQREIHDGILTREEQRIEQRRLEQTAQYLLDQLKKN